MNAPPPDAVDALTTYLSSLRFGPFPYLGERVQRAVLEREATRLVAHLEGLATGELRWLGLAEAWDFLDVVRRAEPVQAIACTLRCDRLREIDSSLADTTFDLIAAWATTDPRPIDGQLHLVVASELDVTRDPAALHLATTACEAGWRVTVGAADSDSVLAVANLRGKAPQVVRMRAVESPREAGGVSSVVKFENDEDEHQRDERVIAPAMRSFSLPSPVGGLAALPTSNGDEERPISVADLFGERIMLRDFEPRAGELDGISALRDDLGWDSIYVPRKNEPDYGQALLRIMRSGNLPSVGQVVYVGDTLLNDGGAISSLQKFGPPNNVWGFLCGATKAMPERDFVVGRIYFGGVWASLADFLVYAKSDGLELGPNTWMLFDLDQTVYAAKGRDDEPLVRARWDAARAYLEQIVPTYKFDATRAEALYREFDRDDYHPVTRDNLDYVVLLVLAVASGLADASEIRDYATSNRPSISALAEELRRRAAMRVGHEDVGAVLDAVTAVFYNTLAGDQTPCKDFRRLECLAMAARMRGEVGDASVDRIYLNREVVDVIRFVNETGTNLFAVSDRPLEAAVTLPDADGGPADPIDLMEIKMITRGVRLTGKLTQSY